MGWIRKFAFNAVVISALISTHALATEGGTSLYILGLQGPMAGFVPPPAFYLTNDLFFYSGDFARGRRTQLGGAIVADVKETLVVDFFTPTWVTPVEILGGNLGFAVTVPFGSPRVQSGALTAAPRLGRIFSFRADDEAFNVGDPVVSTFIGWHSGKFHWSVGGSASIPSGAYRDGQLSNVSLNRPVGDIHAALTYLDPAIGLDISGLVGFEINGENPATNYRSGNAVHVDLAISKYLSKEFTIGVLASHYEQISADRGSPLGSFKGRTTAVGGTASYTVALGQVPVTFRVKVLREVEVQNRPQGTAAFLSVSLPLGGGQPPAAAPRTIAARH